MHAPDDSTTPSRSVTVMRRLIRPWEYRHRRAVAGVRRPDERYFRLAVELGEPHCGGCAHGRFRNLK